ncbi:hypothetical protein [Streptomyces sp. NBC_01483]|uniref:hypothetical protein n=1 Tax=Streptomyces sp. NBC_01483 TaxID=2903883 RepID=UPI002E2F340C|nr:hypothetical protein [Streptomyces sp. NBC_01483]
MTLVQTRQRPVDPAPTNVADVLDASGPRVGDDVTVEVALFLMASARVGYLLLCDQDEHCTGSVTWAQLALVRDNPAYTDRIRVRDVLDAGGPFASPVTTALEAEHATRRPQLGALPVVAGEQGRGPCAPALSR